MKKVYSSIKFKDRFVSKFNGGFDEEEEEKKLNCIQIKKKTRNRKNSTLV